MSDNLIPSSRRLSSHFTQPINITHPSIYQSGLFNQGRWYHHRFIQSWFHTTNRCTDILEYIAHICLNRLKSIAHICDCSRQRDSLKSLRLPGVLIAFDPYRLSAVNDPYHHHLNSNPEFKVCDCHQQTLSQPPNIYAWIDCNRLHRFIDMLESVCG